MAHGAGRNAAAARARWPARSCADLACPFAPLGRSAKHVAVVAAATYNTISDAWIIPKMCPPRKTAMTLPVLSVCRCIQLSQSSAIWRGAAPTVVSGARPHEGSQKAQACAHKGKCPPWRALGAILRETWRDLERHLKKS